MFGGDPFDAFGTRRHMRQMEQMMDSMMADSFGNSFFPGFGHPMMGMLEDGNNRNRQRRTQNNQQIASPFGFGGGIFGNMMQQMQMFENGAANDPHSHVFSQSTMISYDGSGQPKVVTKSVRKSGDVKETRRTVKDGEREEITVGHAIGDRAHIIEKKRDRDGRVRKNQKYVNLDEDEAEHFNNEFKTRAHRNINSLFGDESTSSSRHRAAIENGRSSRHHDISDEMEHSGRPRGTTAKKETQPIIEIPSDDDDDIEILEPNNPITYSNNRSGPRISEVTEDDGSSSKRRKGMFGKFFANDD
jgi:myeloid leukemia factor 1